MEKNYEKIKVSRDNGRKSRIFKLYKVTSIEYIRCIIGNNISAKLIASENFVIWIVG